MGVAKSGSPQIEEVPVPTCRDGEVLVKTAYSLISTGTETWTIVATEPLKTSAVVSNKDKLRKAIGLVGDVYRKEGLEGVLDYAADVRNPRVALGYSLSGTVVQVGHDIRDVVVGDLVACAGEGKAVHAEFACAPRNLVAKVPEGVTLEQAAFSTV